ncbi:MAG: NusG domain II-containing protein [Treponema sp.]|nr:NusG domain II-containing protein [Treponema sp.]MCL2237025.1 NusG domain II-containing protein [Treponema sp.]
MLRYFVNKGAILKIKLVDIIIIMIAACIVFFAVYAAYIKPQDMLNNILIRASEDEWTFPVNAEETIVVTGPLGKTIVRLHNSSAWIESSPCDNQTCMSAGLITKQGQWTACLPNNVLLMMQGTINEDDDVDALSR